MERKRGRESIRRRREKREERKGVGRGVGQYHIQKFSQNIKYHKK